MSSKHNPQEHDALKESLPYQGYDPIAASWKQAPAFNDLWIKNGESQTIVQRIGFSILSLFILGGGVGIGFGAFRTFQEEDHGWVVVALVCIVFIYLGIRGLRNALRFPRK
jgi:hypothetical protein